MSTARQVAEKVRKEYLLIVALAAKSGNEGDLREACDLTEKAIESALLAQIEECAKVADGYAACMKEVRLASIDPTAQQRAYLDAVGENLASAIRHLAHEEGRG